MKTSTGIEKLPGALARLFSLAALIMVVSGCSDRSRMVDEAVELGLIREGEEDHWMLTRHRRGVICGKWDSTAEGAIYREAFRYFIIKDGEANRAPNRGAWQVFCAEDPAAGLKKRFGIGPIETEEELAAVRKIIADMASIVDALNAYQRDNRDYPYTHQGLGILTGAGGVEGQSASYLSELPLDPWGRPYRYEYSELSGGVAVRYKLYTLGADDKRGGERANADINADHIQFIDYVVNP